MIIIFNKICAIFTIGIHKHLFVYSFHLPIIKQNYPYGDPLILQVMLPGFEFKYMLKLEYSILYMYLFSVRRA